MTALATDRIVTSRGRLPNGAPNPVDVHVGNRIRAQRIIVGLSQETLGHAIGLTFQQVQKYERGANRVGASRLFDIARALGVNVDFFFAEMPDATQGTSPAQMTQTTTAPPPPAMLPREVLEMVRAYNAIKSESARRQVRAMAHTLAGTLDETVAQVA